MPIFEYICKDCGSDFELIVKSASEKVKCVECESGKVEKKLSLFSAGAGKSPADSCDVSGSCPVAGTSCCSSGSCGKHG